MLWRGAYSYFGNPLKNEQVKMAKKAEHKKDKKYEHIKKTEYYKK